MIRRIETPFSLFITHIGTLLEISIEIKKPSLIRANGNFFCRGVHFKSISNILTHMIFFYFDGNFDELCEYRKYPYKIPLEKSISSKSGGIGRSDKKTGLEKNYKNKVEHEDCGWECDIRRGWGVWGERTPTIVDSQRGALPLHSARHVTRHLPARRGQTPQNVTVFGMGRGDPHHYIRTKDFFRQFLFHILTRQQFIIFNWETDFTISNCTLMVFT